MGLERRAKEDILDACRACWMWSPRLKEEPRRTLSSRSGSLAMVRQLAAIRNMERRGQWSQHVGSGMHSGIWMFGHKRKHKTVLMCWELVHSTKNRNPGNVCNYITG